MSVEELCRSDLLSKKARTIVGVLKYKHPAEVFRKCSMSSSTVYKWIHVLQASGKIRLSGVVEVTPDVLRELRELAEALLRLIEETEKSLAGEVSEASGESREPGEGSEATEHTNNATT